MGIDGSHEPLIRFPRSLSHFRFLTTWIKLYVGMKVVFFKRILSDDETSRWTSSQQIVYSHLLAQSILRQEGAFNENGNSIDYVKVITGICDQNQEIDIVKYSAGELSRILNLSRQNVYDSINFLKLKNYIRKEKIYCPQQIIESGYFELITKSKLSKLLLVFYSWLCERGENYNNTVDTYSYRIAELFGTNECNIRMMIHRLATRGFVKRIADCDKRYGKLLIKK